MRVIFRSSRAVLAVVLLVPASATSAGINDDVNVILMQIAARRAELHSGVFRVAVTSGMASNPTKQRKLVYEYAVEANKWARRAIGYSNVRINKDGALFKYYEVKQDDGEVDKILGIHDSSRLQESESTCSWLYCGSLWDLRTLEYLTENAHRVVVHDAGGGTRSSVEGNQLLRLTIAVPANDILLALSEASPPLAGGAELEITVDQEKGGVIPRIEVRGNAHIGCVIECYEFIDIGAGVYFPKRCRRQWFNDVGQPGHFEEYVLLHVAHVNQDVPTAYFELNPLPIGAYISDKRTGSSGIAFRLGKSAPTLEEVVDRLAPQLQTTSPTRFIFLVVPGVLVVCVLIAFYFKRVRV